MKFLADMGVSPLTVQALRQQGYDAVHLMDERLERLPDPFQPTDSNDSGTQS